MSLVQFADKWGSGDCPPRRVSDAELADVEHQFRIRLPADYRDALLEVGLPHPAPALVNAIVERKLTLLDPNDFYAPADIIKLTLNWREAGMPAELVAFAGDGCGNQFCFDRDRLAGQAADSQAVFFWDREYETVRQVAPSFEAWIEALCEVEP